MKLSLFTFLSIIAFSGGSFGLSIQPCSEEQNREIESISFIPGTVVTLHVATLVTSQLLWVASTSKDKGEESKNQDGDNTLYWLLPSLGFDFAVLAGYPGCGSFILKEGKISEEETEHQIKINTRLSSAMSLLGQFVSLTNTLDEDKRKTTRTLMGATIVSQFLFEWLWSYRESTPVATIQPYLNDDAKGIQFVYRF